MSKIFLIGDVHIGLGYPNKVDKWHKTHIEYFDEFLIPLLKDKVVDGDIIVMLGDLFDNRNVIPINLMNYVMDVVESISKIAPLHIIIGNHDLWSKSMSEINSVRPLRYIKNVTVYDSVSILEFNNLKILMMPYLEDKNEQIQYIQKYKHCDYLFCHSDLNGCKMHLTSVANRNMDKIDINEFKYFRMVRSGHIHLVQKNSNFTFVGSVFQMDRNDFGDQKGIFVIDTKDDSEIFYPNNISPVFKRISILNESDIDNLDSFKNTKDYVDLSISNNLLVSNRKFRRKLETILESGNFSSVEYIDDINKIVKDEKIDESIDIGVDIGLDVSISTNIDYVNVIEEYINITINNVPYREGILSEFNEIVRIYNENYKINQLSQ